MVVPVYSASHGLETEVTIDEAVGLKHASALHCDEITSLPRNLLRSFVGAVPPEKMAEVNRALAIALDITPEDIEDL
jgi:mRNA interferase MazF